MRTYRPAPAALPGGSAAVLCSALLLSCDVGAPRPAAPLSGRARRRGPLSVVRLFDRAQERLRWGRTDRSVAPLSLFGRVGGRLRELGAEGHQHHRQHQDVRGSVLYNIPMGRNAWGHLRAGGGTTKFKFGDRCPTNAPEFNCGVAPRCWLGPACGSESPRTAGPGRRSADSQPERKRFPIPKLHQLFCPLLGSVQGVLLDLEDMRGDRVELEPCIDAVLGRPGCELLAVGAPVVTRGTWISSGGRPLRSAVNGSRADRRRMRAQVGLGAAAGTSASAGD